MCTAQLTLEALKAFMYMVSVFHQSLANVTIGAGLGGPYRCLDLLQPNLLQVLGGLHEQAQPCDLSLQCAVVKSGEVLSVEYS